jgi:hypothetical protein
MKFRSKLILLPAAALANIYAQAAAPTLDCYDTPRGAICFDYSDPPDELVEHPNRDNPANEK